MTPASDDHNIPESPKNSGDGLTIVERIYGELTKAGIKRADVQVEPTRELPLLFSLVFWGGYSAEIRQAIQMYTCLRLIGADTSVMTMIYVPDSWLDNGGAA